LFKKTTPKGGGALMNKEEMYKAYRNLKYDIADYEAEKKTPPERTTRAIEEAEKKFPEFRTQYNRELAEMTKGLSDYFSKNGLPAEAASEEQELYDR
jgi:hypothetical protein